jgi:hypothetical protein
MEWWSDASWTRTARTAGAIYALVFVAGSLSLMLPRGVGSIAALAAGVLYIAVTVLLYRLFAPVDRYVSVAAAAVSLFGIAAGPLRLTSLNPLVFFGAYCLLLGYLIVRSTFAPRALGILMACAGVGWLSFLSPALGRSLYPYNLAPGIIGEGALTVWLLFGGAAAPGRMQSLRRSMP